MMKDLNSYDTDNSTYRECIKKLLKENEALRFELDSVYSSHGWKILQTIRKVSPIHFKKPSTEPKKYPYNHNLPLRYNSHYEDNIDYSRKSLHPEVKTIAFYLPQFHSIKENDQWWGKGFTEWTNVRKAKPKGPGHYQPKEPHDDIGYYALDNIDTIKDQVKLAKQHGIYGFCFYYYWFSGKRLLEKPVDLFLNNKDINFPFCLCWANENWTRTWNGLNKNILIKQDYSDSDPEQFIIDIKKYLTDKRYIRINNKPVILIYAPDNVPNLNDVITRWRKKAIELGIGEILVWTKSTIFTNATYDNCDAEFDFAPTSWAFYNSIIEHNDTRLVYDYSNLVKDYCDKKYYLNHFPVKPFYYSCTMGWDNSARKEKGYAILDNYSPESFYDWLRLIIEETKRRFKPDERFIFINAWNEWAEGTYLEPDKKYGYTNINTLSKAIYGLPYDPSDNLVLTPKSPTISKTNKKIAIQIHVFYTDILEELLCNLAKIPFEFDLYISTDTQSKKQLIQKKLENYKLKSKITRISIIENIGRDVYPFIKQLSKTYSDYDIIGHFHTKKTVTQPYGKLWRQHIYHNLLDSTKNISRIMALFENDQTGMVIPTCFYGVQDGQNLNDNAPLANEMLSRLGYDKVSPNERIIFPVGTMFWAKTDAISDIFKLFLSAKDFPEEKNQINGTISHALERMFGIIPKKKGYDVIQVSNLDKTND